MITIRTNNQARDLIQGYELTDKERKEFDYYDDEQIIYQHFARYKGELLDLSEFVRIAPFSKRVGFEHGTDDDELLKWQGIKTESYFSGLLVKYTEDCEQVIIASYSC